MKSTRNGTKSDEILARARRRGQGFARVDFRGHGDSGGNIDSITISGLIADIAAVVSHVGPCVLIGSSMGALAAAWFAATDYRAAGSAGDVAALVLLSPALGYLPEMTRKTDSYELRRSDETLMTLQEKTLRDAKKYDESMLPRAIHVPLLVIHGGADRTVPRARSEGFCRDVPHRDKEFWLIEGGSHSLNEDVGMVLDRVESFLDERGLL